jgi:transglutaminase-like putative cysteine protease
MTEMSIRHQTIYRYAKPVTFGPHRLMVRPRDSHDLRLLGAELAINPAPSRLRWLYDVFGNSIAIAEFEGIEADCLSFDSTIHLEQFPTTMPHVEIEEYARTYPFSYHSEEIPDLARSIERTDADPSRHVDLWAKSLIESGTVDTLGLLSTMCAKIHDEFRYIPREAEGVQEPAETLASGTGTCRDFALLMLAAARALGIAGRFVSGYLGIDGTDMVRSVGNSTHAWVELYLPGAGWIDFDPTNNIIGGTNLVRVAWAREPNQAIPLAGSWTGAPGDYLGMSVDVSIELGGGETVAQAA